MLLLLLTAAFAGPACAQSLDAFKRHLAEPVPSGMFGRAQVFVSEYGDAGPAVLQASRQGARPRLRGYRVCIFMDNGQSGQDARAGAVAARELFEQTYPDVRAYMVYENPYFKVRVGNCLTAEEAIILKGKVSGTFPKAFLTREELTLADLLEGTDEILK